MQQFEDISVTVASMTVLVFAGVVAQALGMWSVMIGPELWSSDGMSLNLEHKETLALAEMGWIIQKRKRLIRAEAAICSGGIERAHSWGTFLIQAD